eukprot:762518-Hanusia_phi.AAC.2
MILRRAPSAIVGERNAGKEAEEGGVARRRGAGGTLSKSEGTPQYGICRGMARKRTWTTTALLLLLLKGWEAENLFS